MGDAFDDYYDRLDSIDTYCKRHDRWYDGAAACPDCEQEHYDAPAGIPGNR